MAILSKLKEFWIVMLLPVLIVVKELQSFSYISSKTMW
jgi:hypothetical protein